MFNFEDGHLVLIVYQRFYYCVLAIHGIRKILDAFFLFPFLRYTMTQC